MIEDERKYLGWEPTLRSCVFEVRSSVVPSKLMSLHVTPCGLITLGTFIWLSSTMNRVSEISEDVLSKMSVISVVSHESKELIRLPSSSVSLQFR